jgi:hypothetical protein
MNIHDDPNEEVRRLESSLAAGIPVDRLTALIAPGMPSAVMERLLEQPRFKSRLSRMMMARLDLPHDMSPDLRFAAFGPGEMKVAVCAAGAIWHHHVIRQVIAKSALHSLVDAIGERAHAIALANGDLAVTPSTTPSVANLVCSIQRAGFGCVEAWLEVADTPIAELARLKLAALDEEFDLTDDHRRFGPTIVRRVATAWPTVSSEA